MISIHKTWIATGATVVLAVSACQRQGPTDGPEHHVSAEELHQSISNTSALTEQYAFEHKDQAVAAIQGDLDDLDARLEAMARKSADYTGQAKLRADQALDRLRAERDAAARQLDRLKSASKETWTQAKVDVDKAWQKLKDSYDQVKDEIHD